MTEKIKIAIFASGGGSNAECIIQHFDNHPHIDVTLIVANKKEAHVLMRAENHKIESWVHSQDDINNGGILKKLEEKQIDFIALAGYLKKIGDDLISAFPNKIINVHPALLPKYGGKGMYGMNVHKAVVDAKEKVSGPTIHFVNENYDEGAIIAQYEVELNENDSASEVADKVLKLEHLHFAQCIENVISESWERR
ncbi:MAG: hypothetical protein BM555_02880 [Crocinitomix sp. MedPE-SWsnd]|jgi:phosphoribosylglycinamide formyltransferase 1|nr:MAG: hypothetical protein BM555_02880 [Crocinitomix sp. MedPE-SWsnd]